MPGPSSQTFMQRSLFLFHSVLVAAIFAACWTARARAAPFPADSGIVNVRAFGAKGDGRADDTAAIRAAIAAARVDQGNTFWPSRIVYFPSGVYRVTDAIDDRDSAGRFNSSMVLVGEARDKVRLRLADMTAGYERPDRPKAVVFTSSKLLGGAPTNGGKDFQGKGEGNDAYGNYVQDMTIDVGRGNPGAVALDFLASNVGAVRRVRLIAVPGSGRVGISLDRKWPGPLLLSDVSIEGFAIGISISQPEYSVTMEDLRLIGQSRVAIRNNGNSIAMRNVDITLSGAIALQNSGADGLVVADRLSVRLAAAGTRWIDNHGYLTMKNVTVSGPKASPGAGGPGSGVSGAYFGNDRLSVFDAGWTLVPESPPAAFSVPPDRWANVARYGAKPDSGGDSSSAIRAAFLSGASTVYFPSGRYEISQALEVPASVRYLVGMYSSITVRTVRAAGFSRDVGILRVGTDGEPLTIEGLALDNTGRGSQVGVEHLGPRTLVLRDLITAGTSISRSSGGGRLFLENTCCGPLRVAGSNGVWARQLNSEGTATRILNAGAPLSVLGLKVEQNCTVVENLRGAQTEILGGLVYQVRPPAEQKPAFVNNEGAELTVSYTEEAYIPGSAYREHVVEIAPDRPVSVLKANQLPGRGALARIMPGLRFPGPKPPDRDASH